LFYSVLIVLEKVSKLQQVPWYVEISQVTEKVFLFLIFDFCISFIFFISSLVGDITMFIVW
jgi:hypothetical protein